MNDQQYTQHCRQVLNDYCAQLAQRTQALPEGDHLRELAHDFVRLASDAGDLHGDGPALVMRLFTHYPDFVPDFPRELLWFMGGECLHFMPDEEIAVYQSLDEMRAEAAIRGELIDFQSARAKLLKSQ
ncbi:MAG: PA2817 family protein [Pseudomonadota bacterium]